MNCNMFCTGKKFLTNNMIRASVSLFFLSIGFVLHAQSGPQTEDDYYAIKTLSIPDEIKLEVGGIAILPDGRVAVSTRRGEIWIIENAYAKDGSAPHYTKFASGLHEVLGL